VLVGDILKKKTIIAILLLIIAFVLLIVLGNKIHYAVRPIITLRSDVIVDDSEGTKNNSYILIKW